MRSRTAAWSSFISRDFDISPDFAISLVFAISAGPLDNNGTTEYHQIARIGTGWYQIRSSNKIRWKSRLNDETVSSILYVYVSPGACGAVSVAHASGDFQSAIPQNDR